MTTDSDDGKRLRRGNEPKRVIERIGDDGDSKDAPRWAVQSHEPPKGAVIRWERFLHVRSIKVLLVENDDSTRHVVTALLRNSNYEVIQAANGFQAWKILEDLNNHIDLVLTEVVMPGLSGIGLLCKMMSHNLRKLIPVITMSSHDSMALVFNCLSKGAVDFLVKPIRKNELKNLWQHIWRRCHSSSGSGSESGAKTQKSVKSKSSIRSEEGSSCSEAYNNRSASLKVGDESEKGSGTQTSWIKQAIEVDSSLVVCSRDQTAECAGNTRTLVIHPNNKVQLDRAAKGKELFTRKRRKFESQSDGPVKGLGQVKFTGREQNSLPEVEFTANSERLDKTPAHRSVEYPSNEYKAVVTNITQPYMNCKTARDDDSKELVGIELCLNRLREVEDYGKIVQSDNRNMLRCSELSAFSRYNTPMSATNDPNAITGNTSQPANTLVKKEYECDIRPNKSNRNILQPSSNGISKNTDMGSITHKISTDPLVLESEPTRNDFSGSHQELPIQHIHHDHHVHHYHDNDFSLKKLAIDSPHCGSSNVLGGPVEGQPKNHILNRSGSSSKHGSNNQNGSSTAANAGGTNIESNTGLEGKDGGGDDASARVTKFCQKRKEPCFQKKVRHQNKQILVEERSRVQFVRQKGHQSSNRATDE